MHNHIDLVGPDDEVAERRRRSQGRIVTAAEIRTMGESSLAEVIRRVAEAESIEIDDGAVGAVARSASGSFRDALGTLDQLVGVLPQDADRYRSQSPVSHAGEITVPMLVLQGEDDVAVTSRQ